MKKSIRSFVLVFTILFYCSIFAQQVGLLGDNSLINPKGIKVINYERLAKKLYNLLPASLDSKIPGIVEATIYNVIIVKKYQPSADYSKVIDKLKGIAEDNPDPSIRAKAYLAGIYLSASDIIDVLPDHQTYDFDYVYKQITDQLEKKLLTANR